MAKAKSQRPPSSKPSARGKAESTKSPPRIHFALPFGISDAELEKAREALSPLLSGKPLQARKAARDHIHRLAIDGAPKALSPIDQLLFASSCAASESSLPGYATLDDKHAADIDTLITLIEEYIDDPSRRRPLNFLMLASPGAGKSHFIDCVARRMHRHKVVPNTFNMASMSTNDELIRPLDDARQCESRGPHSPSVP